jgi:hypothetical protein
MLISCIFSYPPKSAKDYAELVTELPPLPEYITTMKGSYINGAAKEDTITIALYEFEKSKFAEATKHIFNQIGAFHGVSGFTFSARILVEGKEVEKISN